MRSHIQRKKMANDWNKPDRHQKYHWPDKHAEITPTMRKGKRHNVDCDIYKKMNIWHQETGPCSLYAHSELTFQHIFFLFTDHRSSLVSTPITVLSPTYIQKPGPASCGPILRSPSSTFSSYLLICWLFGSFLYPTSEMGIWGGGLGVVNKLLFLLVLWSQSKSSILFSHF